MRFVYPQSILTPRLPDEMFQEEAEALAQAGHAIALVDSEKLPVGMTRIKPDVTSEYPLVYRGWMLSAAEYQNLSLSVAATGGSLLTMLEQYLATHHLPNWYPLIADLTPQTAVLPLDADWVKALTELGWKRFFIKDYVKSLKTSVGSLIERPEDIQLVAAEMEKYRGTIEGGLCIRQGEDFLPKTERRYFVLNGKPHSADASMDIPAIVHECAQRIESKFFSVDVIQRADGQLRIVEIGDGQVSDLVGWSVSRFVSLWNE